MISPPREFTARAQRQRQRELTKRSRKRRKASRNTKQVNNQSKSNKGQSKWKNETKQAKRQGKSKTSKVQRRRIPNKSLVNKETYRTGSPKVYRAMMAINTRFESKSSTEQLTSKGGMTVSKMRPNDNQVLPAIRQAHRDAVY
jgi:hypothetical protein